MALLSGRDLHIAFGGRPLLNGADLHLRRGDRVGFVGRNGEGKSTLLKILAGEVAPDDGEVVREVGLRVAYLPQRVPDDVGGTVASVVRSGLPPERPDYEAERLVSLLELDADESFAELSGGKKRRTLLGRALAEDPDVLLLDEPTNHLDLESIEWLEGFLRRFQGSLVFVTHDRAFVRALATRILELDRGRLTSWDCGYDTFLERREARLAEEEKRWAEQDRKLAKEESWIRTGIKARRTRNQGRVRALEEMRRRRSRRRERVGEVSLTIQEAERSGKRVVVAEDVDFTYGDGEPLIQGFEATLMRGDKVGILGPNGVGKTTLVKLLLGELEPDAGTVEHGTSLQVAYFDQHRAELDLDGTVAENVGFGHDHVEVGGERRHVLGYLQDFLFSPERARQPVSSLSGGERNRLLLARLFTKPANVLVLDEPTNDLDVETLELLEAHLVAFPGTVLAVSHDRSFLDNLCTSTLVFEGGGRVKEYVGGYSDWKRIADRRSAEEAARARARTTREAPEEGAKGSSQGASRRPEGPRKLSWHEKRELEALPDRIEALEGKLEDLHERMGDPAFYQGDAAEIRSVTERASELEEEVEEAVDRWGELEERHQGS